MFLQYIKYIILEFTPSTILLQLPLPAILGIVSTGIIFPLHVYTVLVPYSPSFTISPLPPLPTGTNPPGKTSLMMNNSPFSGFNTGYPLAY
jgi:hypothetical protein